ncbi:MAG: hypothetical protein V2A34_14940, partial [Lentisphaerota bacterium]
MKKNKMILAAVVVAAAAALFVMKSGRKAPEWKTAVVERGPLSVWSIYEGKLESRNLRPILSRIGGSAVLIDVAPEGARVSQGDKVAVFDTSKTVRDLVKLEADVTLARSEYDSLQNAQIPLKLRELEMLIA